MGNLLDLTVREGEGLGDGIAMATKRATNNETRKNAATTTSTASNPSSRPSITAQEPPGPSRDAQTPSTSTDDRMKNFHQDRSTAPSTKTPPSNPTTEAEQLMFQALGQLQEIYNAASKTKANKITIERATFEKIATTFQQAYEQIKTKTPMPTPAPAPENAIILDTLQQIKASIVNLEAMQTIENTPKTNVPDTEITPDHCGSITQTSGTTTNQSTKNPVDYHLKHQ